MLFIALFSYERCATSLPQLVILQSESFIVSLTFSSYVYKHVTNGRTYRRPTDTIVHNAACQRVPHCRA